MTTQKEGYGYVQKGQDSDVHVYWDWKDQTYLCSHCCLEQPHAPPSNESAWVMLAHLIEHNTAGHKVPLTALMALRKAAEGDDDDIAWLGAPLTEEEKAAFARPDGDDFEPL